jgi:hypothetical protein
LLIVHGQTITEDIEMLDLGYPPERTRCLSFQSSQELFVTCKKSFHIVIEHEPDAVCVEWNIFGDCIQYDENSGRRNLENY